VARDPSRPWPGEMADAVFKLYRATLHLQELQNDDGGGPPRVSGDLDLTDNGNGAAVFHCKGFDPDLKGNLHFHKGPLLGSCT
jgi:hypothetical protein